MRQNKKDFQKLPTPEEIEREYVRRLMEVDTEVWDIIRPLKIQASRQESKKEDPMNLPYKTHGERMKYLKLKYQNTSLPVAMCEEYGRKFNGDAEVHNQVPSELKVGDVIKLNIRSISKQGTSLESNLHKENFATRNNLGKFQKLLNFLPTKPVAARILEITPKTTFVDLFEPMVEEFVLPRTERPWIQNQIDSDKVQPIRVKNLRLVKGGYIGDAVIPNITDWLGQEYTIEAFVPGSQIVLNITEDFEEHVGKTVETFITAYAPKPRGNGMSLVCSAKNYLKHQGHLNMMTLHSWWCDAGEKWEAFTKETYPAQITGVINTSKKTGVFVEVPYMNVAGMVYVPEDELVNYASGTWVQVRFVDFDEEQVFNENVGQLQRLPAFEKEDGAIKKVNIKPILEFA